MRYLAHSAKKSSPQQDYEVHVRNVRKQALHNVQGLLSYYHGDQAQIGKVIELAAELHDLGKLAGDNQAVLHGKTKSKALPINHVDAGTTLLKDRQNIFAAVLVYAHHIGLFSRSEEAKKGNLLLRDVTNPTCEDTKRVVAK